MKLNFFSQSRVRKRKKYGIKMTDMVHGVVWCYNMKVLQNSLRNQHKQSRQHRMQRGNLQKKYAHSSQLKKTSSNMQKITIL